MFTLTDPTPNSDMDFIEMYSNIGIEHRKGLATEHDGLIPILRYLHDKDFS